MNISESDRKQINEYFEEVEIAQQNIYCFVDELKLYLQQIMRAYECINQNMIKAEQILNDNK